MPDDGHTVYSMENVVNGGKNKDDGERLTRAEKWAAIRAALGHFMPIVLLVVGCFCLTGLLIYFWLH